MKKLELIVSLWALLTATPLLAQQALILQLPDTLVRANDTLQLDISTQQFTNIVSLQFSMKWDTAVMRYVRFETTDLPFAAIGSNEAKKGILRFSWFDIEGKGQTLANGKSIVRLKFFVHGNPGDFTTFNFTDVPLDIQVFRATTGGNFQEVQLEARNGLVTVSGGAGVLRANLGVTNLRCTGGNDGAINTTLLNAPSGSTIRWSGPNNFQSQQEDIANLRAGTYTLEILGSGGIVLLDTMLTITQPATAVSIDTVQIDSAGCAGATGAAVITASGGTTPYTYSINTTFGPNNRFVNLAAGRYPLTVRDANNCIVSDTFQVFASSAQVLIDTIITAPAGCTQATGMATIRVLGGTAPYTYSVGGAFVSNNQFANLAVGRYTLTVRDAKNCTNTDTFSIQASNAPQVELGDTVFICPGENMMLDAGTQTTYRWSNGATTRTISVAQPGIFSVTVTNTAGCSASDTVRVLADAAFNLRILNDTFGLCPAQSTVLQPTAAETYRWIDTSKTLSQLNIAMPVAKPRFTTRYTVIASNGCTSDTASIEIKILETAATAGPDTCIVPGEVLELYASGGEDYFWFSSKYPVSNPNIPNPTTQPEDSTSYYIMITDLNGCTIMDTLNVMIANNPLDIKAVNLITPNGDGKNDVLEFNGLAKYGVNTLKVYNRWGDQVYQKINYQKDTDRFDGTRNGKPLPAGNYFYVLSFQTGDIKQTLTIVRE